MSIWDDEENSGLESAWREDAASLFLQKLRENRALEMMKNKDMLKQLRYEPKMSKQMQRWFGAIWARHNTDIYKLIAQACNETWDLEDEEKHAFVRETAKKESAVNNKQRKHDDLVATRETGARRWEHKLQRVPEKSKCLVEEEQGQTRSSSSPQKEKARKEKVCRRRREEFYRRAGGCS